MHFKRKLGKQNNQNTKYNTTSSLLQVSMEKMYNRHVSVSKFKKLFIIFLTKGIDITCNYFIQPQSEVPKNEYGSNMTETKSTTNPTEPSGKQCGESYICLHNIINNLLKLQLTIFSLGLYFSK